ncbi:complement C1q tumor necrosis factor-related protein 4-like [Pecten maximus]|uniref:complement C1q tumor necrosis factor-related protein 4-like n=1 Tax=Pecten maximus TaxID=6579 RepID=UPI001458F746|nr:complement C1q tumor necrosis factor-related protein 4-like [Pecten maximus]
MNVFIDKLVTERMAEVESRFMKEISDLKAGYVLLESENNRLKSKIDTIETTVGLLEVENRMLHSKVDSLENELQMTKAVSSSKTSPVNSENETDVQNVYRRVAPDHPTAPQVAFKARLTHTLTDVGPREIIEFDAVELNIGNDYNPATSVFTCDTPGLYAFHLAMMLKRHKYVELYFQKNGQTFHNFYLADDNFWGTGSTMSLIQLDRGDTVWVKSDQYHPPGDLTHPNFCYFSGYLLYPRI